MTGSILVVDDEVNLREGVKDNLEACGFFVREAGSGEEAIKLFIQHSDSIALVLTDLMMPGIGGVELIRTLRIIKADVRFIATSGLEQEDNRSAFSSLGVMDVLPKPSMPALLLKAVSQALRGERSRAS